MEQKPYRGKQSIMKRLSMYAFVSAIVFGGGLYLQSLPSFASFASAKCGSMRPLSETSSPAKLSGYRMFQNQGLGSNCPSCAYGLSAGHTNPASKNLGQLFGKQLHNTSDQSCSNGCNNCQPCLNGCDSCPTCGDNSQCQNGNCSNCQSCSNCQNSNNVLGLNSQSPKKTNKTYTQHRKSKLHKDESRSSRCGSNGCDSASSQQPTNTTVSSPSDAQVILNLVNQARSSNGLGTVTINPLLSQAALAKSKDMSNKNYFSHIGPDGNNDFYFVKQVGYKYSAIGSNIAQGNFDGMQGLFNAWMGSEGHRANILANYGTQIGFGEYNGYYTLMIAQPAQ